MGFEHSMSFSAKFKPGTTPKIVATALQPVLGYSGYDESFNVAGDDEISYNQETGDLDWYSAGEVGWNFCESVQEMAKNLSGFVIEPGEIELRNHDTGDLENAISHYFFGPSENAIKRYQADKYMTEALELLQPHFPDDALHSVSQILIANLPGTSV